MNCDLPLTLMGSSFYRMPGEKIGGAYATAEARLIFRDFEEASARVGISDHEVAVQLVRRAHHRLLVDAGFSDASVAVPWWGDRRLRLAFG